nr:MAG TPA: hypothetical protein [Caudoviricetes sp.]
MSNNSSNSANGGIGFFGLLAVVFIVLKLLKIISWSWLWVLCPLWAPAIIVLIIYFILYLIVR